uniref:MAM domain-containing protein n=1 Tax=Heterorhabditis bacteriophora TaxID=37862 RepID=A0A1I7XRL5_HETBA
MCEHGRLKGAEERFWNQLIDTYLKWTKMNEMTGQFEETSDPLKVDPLGMAIIVFLLGILVVQTTARQMMDTCFYANSHAADGYTRHRAEEASNDNVLYKLQRIMEHMLHITALLLLYFTICVTGCYPQFEKELRYLDLYLGIKPDNSGQIPQKGENFPNNGFSHFVELTVKAGIAAFQNRHILHHTFHPQLILTVILKVTVCGGMLVLMVCLILLIGGSLKNRTIKCFLFKFSLGILKFGKDNIVGSMVIINNITYRAETCGESPFPSIFSSVSLDPPSAKPVETISDLNCDHPRHKCRWSNAESTVSEWRIGRSVERWQELMEVSAMESKPNSSFLFLVVDSLSPRPYATLRSELIPCTQRTTTLSLKYWLKAGTQVEICSVDEYGVPLSCAYLVEEDSPGPIEVDVDAYDKPFRFTLEIIAFDETAIGLVAIADIHLSSLLCSEEPPPVLTTIDPPTIISLFGLQRGPGANVPYPLTLDCDFSRDYCSQWVNDDGRVAYGVAPRESDKFPMPREIKGNSSHELNYLFSKMVKPVAGNVATFLLPGKSSSILRSREVPCAHEAMLVFNLHCFRSEHGSVHLCALDKCVEGTKPSGIVSVLASSLKPFEFTIEASSRKNSIVVISNIAIIGDVCPLKTVEQTVCEKLKCSFQGNNSTMMITHGLCHYQSPVDKVGDVPLAWTSKGLTVTLDGTRPRAVLRSPRFDLPAPSLLIISLTQKTYGSRVLLCPDEMSESESCHELLGPRVIASALHRISFPLDAGVHRFVLILYHDKAEQFGPALFDLHSIDIRTSQDYQLCF